MIRPRKHRSNAPATETEHAELWRDSAACKPNPDTDPETWFPGSTDEETEAEAKAICAGCPVRDACLTWATAPETRQDYGIWGGTTPEERRKLRRKETRTPKARPAFKCEGCGRTFITSQTYSKHVLEGHPTHCKNGHEWTPRNTLPRSGGGRACRDCKNKSLRESRARLKKEDAA